MKTYEADVRVTFLLDAPDEETAQALIDWACNNAQWAERHHWLRLIVIADGDDEEVDGRQGEGT